MLPNVFQALVYGSLQWFVNARDGVGLHSRQYVAVQIERDADLAVSQAFAGNLRVHAAGQHMRCVCVPQVVESNAGQGRLTQQPNPLRRDARRLQRLRVCLRDNEAVVMQPDAEQQQVLRLPGPMRAQLVEHNADSATVLARPLFGSL